eukprot:2627848-Rhodomonas_salina.4
MCPCGSQRSSTASPALVQPRDSKSAPNAAETSTNSDEIHIDRAEISTEPAKFSAGPVKGRATSVEIARSKPAQEQNKTCLGSDLLVSEEGCDGACDLERDFWDMEAVVRASGSTAHALSGAVPDTAVAVCEPPVPEAYTRLPIAIVSGSAEVYVSTGHGIGKA